MDVYLETETKVEADAGGLPEIDADRSSDPQCDDLPTFFQVPDELSMDVYLETETKVEADAEGLPEIDAYRSSDPQSDGLQTFFPPIQFPDDTDFKALYRLQHDLLPNDEISDVVEQTTAQSTTEVDSSAALPTGAIDRATLLQIRGEVGSQKHPSVEDLGTAPRKEAVQNPGKVSKVSKAKKEPKKKEKKTKASELPFDGDGHAAASRMPRPSPSASEGSVASDAEEVQAPEQPADAALGPRLWVGRPPGLGLDTESPSKVVESGDEEELVYGKSSISQFNPPWRGAGRKGKKEEQTPEQMDGNNNNKGKKEEQTPEQMDGSSINSNNSNQGELPKKEQQVLQTDQPNEQQEEKDELKPKEEDNRTFSSLMLQQLAEEDKLELDLSKDPGKEELREEVTRQRELIKGLRAELEHALAVLQLQR
eukprot:TRINITY_DN8566_c1_g1_i1.p1 TRINITY_DN8566_c1_g1~~TRINITY_DN8566_c1_g1_i1.p1  ORF type:complete len:461 (+),score=115.33 TRINITY_DN8566_c1_g1_i1:113-1384(+)